MRRQTRKTSVLLDEAGLTQTTSVAGRRTALGIATMPGTLLCPLISAIDYVRVLYLVRVSDAMGRARLALTATLS